jgi:hypothetical protein
MRQSRLDLCEFKISKIARTLCHGDSNGLVPLALFRNITSSHESRSRTASALSCDQTIPQRPVVW